MDLYRSFLEWQLSVPCFKFYRVTWTTNSLFSIWYPPGPGIPKSLLSRSHAREVLLQDFQPHTPRAQMDLPGTLTWNPSTWFGLEQSSVTKGKKCRIYWSSLCLSRCSLWSLCHAPTVKILPCLPASSSTSTYFLPRPEKNTYNLKAGMVFAKSCGGLSFPWAMHWVLA